MNYSERGFGARVANAQKILEQLKTLGDYIAPTNDLSIESVEKLINLAHSYNELTTSSVDEYTKAVDLREKLFKKEPDSLLKLIPSIRAATRSIYGRKSQELESVTSISRKARGTKLKKLTKNPDEASISQSELSYGSLTKVLSDIIVILDKRSDTYTPGNSNIQLQGLKTLHKNIQDANKAVTNTLVIQRNTRDLRIKTYEALHDRMQRVKDAVKSQYSATSIEYKLIKNIVA